MIKVFVESYYADNEENVVWVATSPIFPELTAVGTDHDETSKRFEKEVRRLIENKFGGVTYH